MSNKDKALYGFADYLLDGEKRVLWRGKKLVSLPPKAFDTLFVLVKRGGDVVSKDEIFETVWADSFVEDNNLSQSIFAIRRALDSEGEKSIIETIPRKGFRLTVEVILIQNESESLLVDSTRLHDVSDGEYLIASETETEVIEEVIIEDVADQKQLPPVDKVGFLGRRVRMPLAIFGVLLLVGISFGGYAIYDQYRQNLVRSGLDNLTIKSLTSTGDIDLPAISPDGKFAVYLKGDGQEQSLELRDIALGEVTELKINGSVKPGFTRFSKDGKRIYFRDGQNGNSAGKIYKVSYLGGTAELVAENVWGYFSFSSDETKMSFYRREPDKNRFEAIVRDVETGKEEVVATRYLPQRFFIFSNPSFSPDGKELVLIERGENNVDSKLIVVDLENNSESEFKTPGILSVRRIEWVADDQMFAVARARRQVPQLHQIQYPGGQSTRLTRDLKTYRSLSVTADRKTLLSKTVETVSNISIYRDGNFEKGETYTNDRFGRHGFFGVRWTSDEKLVFVSRSDRTRTLWKLNPSDGSRVQLTKEGTGRVNQLPTVSSDGSIYFNSDRDGKMRIWKIDSNGRSPEKVLDSKRGQEVSPVVSNDGKWLYYIQKTRKASSIWRKPLAGGKQEEIKVNGVSPENYVSISPNGKYLAFEYFRKNNENSNQENTRGGQKIGVLNLEDRTRLYSYDLETVERSIRWSEDGNSFDYIQSLPEGGSIWRQTISDEKVEPTKLFSVSKRIFNFDWSKDWKHLAVAVGKVQRDAVVINVGKK